MSFEKRNSGRKGFSRDAYGRNRSERPDRNSGDRSERYSHGNKDQSGRSQGDKARGDKARGDKSQGDISQGGKPQGSKTQDGKTRGSKSFERRHEVPYRKRGAESRVRKQSALPDFLRDEEREERHENEHRQRGHHEREHNEREYNDSQLPAQNLVVGRKPVLEALKAGENLEHVYVLSGLRGDIITQIFKLARNAKIKINEVPSAKLRSMVHDANTQGVVAVKAVYNYHELDELIYDAKKAKYPLLLILDSIQDTHNLGAIIRSADCSGVHGVIITKHNSASVNETVTKTSAGATEHVKICRVSNLKQTFDELKAQGFWIIGSSLEDAKDYTEINYKMPVALVMGNEEKGLRRLTAESCDHLVKIPMQGKIQSLNVSVATGVLLFEIQRQRGK